MNFINKSHAYYKKNTIICNLIYTEVNINKQLYDIYYVTVFSYC